MATRPAQGLQGPGISSSAPPPSDADVRMASPRADSPAQEPQSGGAGGVRMLQGRPSSLSSSELARSYGHFTLSPITRNVPDLYMNLSGLRLMHAPSPRAGVVLAAGNSAGAGAGAGGFRDLITVPANAEFEPGSSWYFEMSIKATAPGGALVSVGCCTSHLAPFSEGKQAVLGGIPGELLNSIGLVNNGEIQAHYLQTGLRTLPFAPPFGQSDTVGCGYAAPRHAMFFTINGHHLGYYSLDPGVKCPDLAAVGFESITMCIEVNFGQSGFFYEPRLGSIVAPPPLDLDPPHDSFVKTMAKAQPEMAQRAWMNPEHGMVKLGRKLSTYFTSPTSSSKLQTMARLEADLAEAKQTVTALAEALLHHQDLAPMRNDDLLEELAMTCRKLLVRHANLVQEAPNSEMLTRLLMMNDRIGELLAAADSLLQKHTNLASEADLGASSKAERVSKLLHILRAGDVLAQKNAAACLGDLVKDDVNLSIVLSLSGVHAMVVKTKDDTEDVELRQICATALSQLVARVKDPNESTAQTASQCFGNELDEVLNALKQSTEPLLVAKSLINLVAVFTRCPYPGWLERVIERGAPLLLGVLATVGQPSPPPAIAATSAVDVDIKLAPPRLLRRDSSHRRASSWSHFEAPQPRVQPDELNPVERTAALALSFLARQRGAQSVLVSLDGFFPTVAKLLASSDAQVAQHGAAALGGLFTGSEDDPFTRGFVAGQVLQANVLEPLIALAQSPTLPEATRGWCSLCITNLASHPSSRQALTQFGIDKCADACIRLMSVKSSSSSLNGSGLASPVRTLRAKSSSAGYSTAFAEAGMVDEVRLSAALLQILKLRPTVPMETFARPGSLDTVLTLADSDNVTVVRNAAGILVMLSRSPVIWERSLPWLVKLIEHPDSEARITAASAMADVCTSPELSTRNVALQTHVASKLPKAAGVAPNVVCRALAGLACVVFSPNWEPRSSFFGFGTKSDALPFLLAAVGKADQDSVAAIEAMHALTLACKAKGALSTHYRVETVRSALPAAAAVLAKGTTDAALRHAAEGLLASAIGFSVGDLQLVANDSELLGEWARLALDVRMSIVVDFCLFRLMAHAWPHMADSSALPPFPFFDARVDVALPDLARKDSARVGGGKKTWNVKAAVTELASAPPGEFVKVLAGQLGKSDVYERVTRELNQVAESPKKEFAVKAIAALVRAATPTTPPEHSGTMPSPAGDGEIRDWYDLLLAVTSFSPGRFGTRGWDALPSLVTELINDQMPGTTLGRALALQPSMYLELDGGGGGPHGLVVQPRPRSLVLGNVPKSVPFQVLPRLVADIPASVLKEFPGIRVQPDGSCTLVLRNHRLLGDAKSRLVDALFRAPSVTQIVFSSSIRLMDDEEEELAALVGDLPLSVTSLVFDRILSPAGLRMVMVFLQQRKHVPLLLGFTNLGLTGEEMEPVIRYTGRLQNVSRFGSLRYLDLGGNSLSDSAVASLLRGLTRPGCHVAALHLNDNNLSPGRETVDALLGISGTSHGKQARGEAKIRPDGLLGVPLGVRRLSLARCHIHHEAVSRLFYSLSKKIEGTDSHSALVALDLDGNNLRNAEVHRALMSCVAFNPVLREISFVGNDVGELGVLTKACELNSTLQTLRCDLSDEDAQPIEAALSRNRVHWRTKEETGPTAADQDASNHVTAHDLFVLFSAPLCWRDGEGRLLPLDRLDHEAERELLLQSTAEAQARVGSAPSVYFDFGTTDTLMSALTRRPAALHWSGHGTPTYVAFEDGRGGMHPVSTEQLASICASARYDDLKLVVVSACSSRAVAEAFVRAGVKHVVAIETGMQVLDRAARVFSRAFYLSIMMGAPVGTAFNVGKEAVKSAPSLDDSEASKFVLMGSGNHNEEVVFPRRRPLAMRESPTLFPSPVKWRGLASVGGSDQPIVGRAVDVYHVLVALLSRRLVNVTGPEGMGKSQLCASVAKYLNERKVFEDGVVFVDCSRAKTEADVVDVVYRLLFGDAPVPWRSPMDSIIAELVSRRAVLVFDHVDNLDNDDFRLLLGGLLDRTKGLRVLVIVHSKPGLVVGGGGIPGHDELTHVLGALSPLDSAKLFLRCSPLYHQDSTARPSVFVNFEAGLARHPTLVQLKGVPRDVARYAATQTEAEWAMLVEEVVEGCLPPPVAAAPGS